MTNSTNEPNMYGYYPCPKCKSVYRYSLAKEPGIALCDDCGYREEVEPIELGKLASERPEKA